MLRAALERIGAWLQSRAKPWILTVAYPKGRSCLLEWWNDLGDHPRSHFISMVVGVALLGALKLAVRLAS